MLKLFYSDVGLLTSSYGKKSALGILDGQAAMNMGGVYENVVAQELTAHGFTNLYYFTKKGIGELDFLIETDCVCSIESGPCERVESLQMSGRF